MNKQFIISRRAPPDLEESALLLLINNKDAGIIASENLGTYGRPRYALHFHMFDDTWSLLPVIAADLYHHDAGAQWGYDSDEAALQAAAAILAAHGWTDISKQDKEKGETVAEYALLILMVFGLAVVIFSLIGIDLIHILVLILRFIGGGQ